MRARSFLLAIAAVFSGFGPASAQDYAPPVPGVTEDEVRFVQIAALDGAAAALGNGMRQGIEAAFSEMNASGGIHGRMIRLDSFDDGYQPGRSVKLLDEIAVNNGHFALIGTVGTPTASALLPKIRAYEIPMIGPFTGAGFLRDPSSGPVINLRATYAAEAEAWMEYLVDESGLERIALLYQDDGFGRVGLSASRAALERRDMTLIAEGTYTRNSLAVKEALLDIREADPDAVVMVGAYKPVAEFIRRARELEFEVPFVNISFVGSAALSAELGDDGAGVIVSQVVPFPWADEPPVVSQYQAALEAVTPGATPGFVSLEGYLVGRLAIEAIDSVGPELTRQAFVAAFAELGAVDLDGVQLTFGPDDNQGMDQVFLTRITEGGTFENLN